MLRRWELWLFLLVCAATLVPVWSVPYFPSQDGGAHVDTAYTVLHYHDAALPTYRQYYELHGGLGANWLVTLLLAGLMLVFSPAVAEKLVVSGYILLFAVSVRYALTAVAPENRWLSWFALLLVYNVTLHMGFFNFNYSVALFPLAVGYWLRRHPRWTAGRTLALAALILLIYFLHPISMVMVAVAIGAGTLWPWRGLRASLPPLAAFVPAGVVALLFLTRPGQSTAFDKLPPAPRFRLEDLWFLQSFDAVETWFCVGVLALLGLLVGHRIFVRTRAEGARAHHHAFLVAALLYVVVYALTPDFMAGGGLIKMRVAIYAVVILLLWAAASRIAVWPRLVAHAAVVALLVTQLSFYSSRYSFLNEFFAEFYSGMDKIEPGSTVLPLCFDVWGPGPTGSQSLTRVAPFLHAIGRLTAERRAVNLLNYQANADYFALVYRPELNPFKQITAGHESAFQLHTTPIDFQSYPTRTGGRVDYVLLWGLRQEMLSRPQVQTIIQQLNAGYEQVDISSREHMQLFRRKDLGLAPASPAPPALGPPPPSR